MGRNRIGMDQTSRRRSTIGGHRQVPLPGIDTRPVPMLVASLADRDSARTEAMVQADIYRLLLTADLNLSSNDLDYIRLEVPTGERLRIDIEVGMTVIEVKKDLRKGKVRSEAIPQLKKYVQEQERAFKTRYVGILTDGAEWVCYHLQEDVLAPVSEFTVSSSKPDVDGLLTWLEGVLATTENIRPTPDAIRGRLGAGTSAHELDSATLTALYRQNKDDPRVRTKRLLWAKKLLQTALGTHFQDSDALFVEHTLLVNSSEVIAHAVVGLPVKTLDPHALVSGELFDKRGIHGVVEADFFDWVAEVPGGETFIKALARRMACFDWTAVEHDVLKVLYHSVISAEARKQMGEYYTPDWLAQAVTDAAIERPLQQRVLDPACGSGTFVFHAVRRYIAAADAAGMTPDQILEGVTEHVLGIDLHPVAVTLARVTYLLALGRDRLAAEERARIQVPIYLGDSVQWNRQATTLWSEQHFTIVADEQGPSVEPEKFNFPSALLKDTRRFDELVNGLADKSASPSRKKKSPPPSVEGLFDRLSIPGEMRPGIRETFATMCSLHDQGRDHIWGYYIRNQARPEWLARPESKVDVLIGNPPWLAYRFMPVGMQREFKTLSSQYHLWKGAKLTTQQDLSGLFVVRAADKYLKMGGRLAFVMPNAVLDRGQYAGFQAGAFDYPQAELRVRFGTPWDLKRIRPHFFPRGAAVVFGARSEAALAIPGDVEVWSGRLPREDATWAEVNGALTRASGVVEPEAAYRSAYHRAFHQGATIVPRVLFMVEKQKAGPLGQVAGQTAVRSVRSANEKGQWKKLPSMDGVVETQFVRPVHLGETVLPYRLLTPRLAVIPRDREGLLDVATDRIERYPGMAEWWSRVVQLWECHRRRTSKLSLMQRLNFQRELESQFPTPAQRVVYAKAGMHIAAARLTDAKAVIDHKLYWAPVPSEIEGCYLCAILNSAVITERVRPLMSYGKDERDIDKHVWKLPIPTFDANDERHTRLAMLGERAEQEVASLPVDTGKHFAYSRRAVREYLEASETGREIERLVSELVPPGSA